MLSDDHGNPLGWHCNAQNKLSANNGQRGVRGGWYSRDAS